MLSDAYRTAVLCTGAVRNTENNPGDSCCGSASLALAQWFQAKWLPMACFQLLWQFASLETLQCNGPFRAMTAAPAAHLSALPLKLLLYVCLCMQV